MKPTDLSTWLEAQPEALAITIAVIAGACIRISEAAAMGALADLHSETDGSPTMSHGDVQKKLDVFADECIAEALLTCGHVAAWASEEHQEPTISEEYSETGDYLVVFDPLDGSSNIESNISTGTIFSILPHPFHGTTPGSAGFLQPGRRQLAAGYVIYGPSTVLALSCGEGVAMFTLDRRCGTWKLCRDDVRVPAETVEFAINTSNQRFWEKPVQRYVAECLAGEEGPRGRDFNMRWVASMVAEVHRILTRGGVFLYPRDNKLPRKAGRLRLMYEAAPMAFLIEQAGGAAVTGTQAILDTAPDTLHQKMPVILGSKDEVELIVRYHADPSENVAWQLFKTRSLFVQAQS